MFNSVNLIISFSIVNYVLEKIFLETDEITLSILNCTSLKLKRIKGYYLRFNEYNIKLY